MILLARHLLEPPPARELGFGVRAAVRSKEGLLFRPSRVGIGTAGLRLIRECGLPRREAGRVRPRLAHVLGRVPGVYEEEWVDCHQQVDKFSGNNYKGYATREEAVAKWKRHVWKKKQTKILVPLLLTGIMVMVYYILS